MTITPIETDTALPAAAGQSNENAFMRAVSEASAALERADAAETAFAAQRGGLQEAVLERAKADVMLAIATTAASRTTQALSSIMNMQV